MALIDLDKFVASFITEMKECSQMRNFSIPRCIKKALDDQGLEYKDGEIVKSQRRVSAEAKEAGYGESKEERIMEKIIATIHLYYGEPLEDEAKEMLAWLEKQGEQNPFDYENAKIIPKDFAPKVGQKPIWGDKDDSMFQSCIGAVATNDYYKGEEKEQIYDWLKSLKQRYTWKPSKEQMDAMQMAVSYFGYSWTSKEQKLLESLYKDLKKL